MTGPVRPVRALVGRGIQECRSGVEKDAATLLGKADVILRINPTPKKEIGAVKKGAVHVSLLDPYNNRDLVEAYAAAGVNAVSLEMIPRTTLAQKMDVLSSQASLAGYVAVIKAADRLNRIFPMMMTPAGTLTPAKVFVIGAGVAGLQAIATAKRLGARVEAFDTRPVVEEQVQSLGAKFLKVDLGETGQTKDGYAKALTDEQLALQREAMARAVAAADVTITTAKLFGRKAPVLITAEMLKGVKPGSVIVDLAAGSGGNVEGVKVDEEVLINGVRIIGIDNLPGEVSVHASQMLASNMVNLFTHLRDAEKDCPEDRRERRGRRRATRRRDCRRLCHRPGRRGGSPGHHWPTIKEFNHGNHAAFRSGAGHLSGF